MLVAVFLGLKWIYLRAYQHLTPRHANDRLNLIPFLLIFSVIMLIALHGTSTVKLAIILSMNYAIAKSCKGSKLGPLFTWLFNAAVLIANEMNGGYRFSSIHSSMQFLVRFLTAQSLQC